MRSGGHLDLDGITFGTVIVNGHHVHGLPGFIISFVGMVGCIVVTVCASIIALFALAGSGFLVLGCLAFTGLLLAALVVPFLLPLLIPVIIVGYLMIRSRPARRPNA